MFLNDWIKKNRVYRSNKFNKKLQRAVSIASTPSILSNNCIGGVIYHNLGLKFLSPTINLYMENADFLLFVTHLREFINGEMKEVKGNTGKTFPVGELSCPCGVITIYFSHYSTFSEAKQKWQERAGRIDWENIVVIMEEGIDATDEIVEKFQELPYEKKVLICNGNKGHVEVKQGLPFFIYDKRYYPGKILSFGRFKISKKRYLDEFDYVEFLNTGKIRKRSK